jgi:hypothetical protein
MLKSREAWKLEGLRNMIDYRHLASKHPGLPASHLPVFQARTRWPTHKFQLGESLSHAKRPIIHRD